MDKKKLIETIISQLEKDLVAAKETAKISREAATNEESKPENEYDTRALEASYLAGAQSKRVVEIEELISIYRFVQPKSFKADDPISSTALVEVELEGRRSYLFIMSKGGGLNFEFGGMSIQIVTPNSPLGETLLGLHAGDVALVEIGNTEKEYEILSVS
ncbi:GreA/GreB family elongation factor [Bdellovibrio sp. HCB2-146]|uniref:GreA/GreB family elongation factor n=1 Tax=Bdellovibrio sp. HCB2-146 TaxID=3394362 RepID=UPI0039BC691E